MARLCWDYGIPETYITDGGSQYTPRLCRDSSPTMPSFNDYVHCSVANHMQTHTVRFSQTVQEHRAPTRHGTVWKEPEGSCGLPKRAGAVSHPRHNQSHSRPHSEIKI